MKLKDVYIKLNEINKNLEDSNIADLLSNIKKEVEIEEASKNGSRSARLKKCVSIITKSKQAKIHPALSNYIINENGLQVVTDSYIAAALVEEDFISGLNKDDSGRYPKMDRVFNLDSSYTTYKFSISEVKAAASLKQDFYKINETYFNPTLLWNLCYLLNIDNQKECEIQLAENRYRVAYILKSKGSKGAICPVVNPQE